MGATDAMQQDDFDFTNPNPTPLKRPPLPRLAQPDIHDPEALAVAAARHTEEISARLRWCLDHGRLPAHDNVHTAPGDDANFMVRILFLHRLL